MMQNGKNKRHWLMLLTLIMLLTSCAGNSQKSGVNSQPVKTGRISADAARRQTAAETASLLADLYEESDRRAGEIAKYADAAASAGRVCERTYEAVTRSVE
ncbi:DUF2514 family protein [Klebsiella oxytoca]|uniref:DUF2514 family protein n=1 Tax=Klebsiella oxytoca TaxID=571 RepID=UPI001D1909C2|nr:DUF2514 family protein [Klebsiella oxytoca]